MNDLIPIESNEELKELETIKQENLKLTPKQREWLRLYLDNTKDEDGKYPKWFGNKTQSALLAYGLDPETQYWSANQIGRENFQKLSNLLPALFEKIGINESTMVQVAAKNMKETRDPRWFEKVQELMGMSTEKPTVVVQQNTQNNYYSDLKDKYRK